KVKADQDIIEVETNKAVFQVTSLCDGEVAELLVERGGTYGVGAVLGYIEATPEEVEKRGLGSAGAASATSAASGPPRAEDGSDAMHGGPDLNPPVWASGQYSTGGPALRVDKRLPAVAPAIPTRGATSGGGFLSPRVRARMSEAGLNENDLAAISGSGTSGRVTADDPERYLLALAANP